MRDASWASLYFHQHCLADYPIESSSYFILSLYLLHKIQDLWCILTIEKFFCQLFFSTPPNPIPKIWGFPLCCFSNKTEFSKSFTLIIIKTWWIFSYVQGQCSSFWPFSTPIEPPYLPARPHRSYTLPARNHVCNTRKSRSPPFNSVGVVSRLLSFYWVWGSYVFFFFPALSLCPASTNTFNLTS